MSETTAAVTVIGGGVVGAAVAYTLAHRGVDTVLLEAGHDLALSASGTNSGCLHTGFDSTPGQLETRMILRTNELREGVLETLRIPVLRSGARLEPHGPDDHAVIAGLAANAAANGVSVRIADDGALEVPGEWITDPVAFTLSIAASAAAAGARIELDSRVTGIAQAPDGLVVALEDGRTVATRFVVNAAGLYADEVARMVGDDSFAIYPRKGEFFVFELPGAARLERILLPVPTKRTKGVLVFPTLDGRVVAGPTAFDQEDKEDWTVRLDAHDEILEKAFVQLPALRGLDPVAAYAGLRPAGVDANYVIGASSAEPRLVNVAAIRSTGLSASLGIGEHVAGLLADAGVEQSAQRAPMRGDVPRPTGEWWRRTALHRSAV
jgi:glycerol-3-phosphate dehydrogenase